MGSCSKILVSKIFSKKKKKHGLKALEPRKNGGGGTGVKIQKFQKHRKTHPSQTGPDDAKNRQSCQ